MTATTTEKITPRLKERYRKEIAGLLREQFGFLGSAVGGQ